MTTNKHTLSKEERLSWKRHIDLLFSNGQSFIAFPLRVIYLPVEEATPARAAILTSVSKKKFKRAVKRNQIKRQIREVYRVRKDDLLATLETKNKNMWIGFLYIDNEVHTFKEMEKAMNKAIRLLCERG